MHRRQKFFAAVGNPFDRSFQCPRTPGDRRVLRVDAGLHAEAAADIAHQHPHLLARQAQHVVAQRILDARWHLRAHANRQPAVFGDPGQHRARLERQCRHALVHDGQCHHMRRRFKGCRSGFRVAMAHLGGDVVRRLVAQGWRAAGQGIVDLDHVRQLLVVDDDSFGRVPCLLHGLGRNQGHGLADEADSFVGQGAARRRGARPAARPLERQGAGNRLDAGGCQLRAGKDTSHTGHGSGGLAVDRHDAGVRIRRADEAQPQLAGRHHVVGKLPQAFQQPFVFDAFDGLAAAEAGGDVGGGDVKNHGVSLFFQFQVWPIFDLFAAWPRYTRLHCRA